MSKCPGVKPYHFNSLIKRIAWERIEQASYRGRVVDLGCGSAPYREVILAQAEEYIGVDWQNSQHDQSRVDVFADLTQPLPFDDNYADTVLAFQVLEHLSEPQAFLCECHRILRPGGTLLMGTPFMWRIHEAPHDYFRYTRYGLEHLLQKARFQDIVIEPFTGFWQMWTLKFNYHSSRWSEGWWGIPLRLLWWFNQWLAPKLDRLDPSPIETTSYWTTARKAP